MSPYWSHPVPTFNILCSHIFSYLKRGGQKKKAKLEYTEGTGFLKDNFSKVI